MSKFWRPRWQSFRHPLNPEKQRLLRARWDSLPAELRTPNQISGRHLTHCGFTTGASYCSFHCTHCYLPRKANQIPIPSLAQMREQIDANRRLQGPGAGLQITGAMSPRRGQVINRKEGLLTGRTKVLQLLPPSGTPTSLDDVGVHMTAQRA